MHTRLFKEETVNYLNHQDVYKETYYSLNVKVVASISATSLWRWCDQTFKAELHFVITVRASETELAGIVKFLSSSQQELARFSNLFRLVNKLKPQPIFWLIRQNTSDGSEDAIH